MSSVDKILGGYDVLQADQEAFYKDLYQHPELSHAGHLTAEHVAGRLQEYTSHSPKFPPRCSPPCGPAPRP